MFDRPAPVTRLSNLLQPILGKEPVYLAYLYGSTARGENTPLSDLDIALAAERDLAPLERLDLYILTTRLVDLDRFAGLISEYNKNKT